MSIWTRISEALSALAQGESLGAWSLTFCAASPEPERSVGFTIAVIALGAKMAKADGAVTRAEVMAFRRVFTLWNRKKRRHAARVFDLARQDVAGFDAYTPSKIGRDVSGSRRPPHLRRRPPRPG
jgi:DnaJ like chaperone protein